MAERRATRAEGWKGALDPDQGVMAAMAELEPRRVGALIFILVVVGPDWLSHSSIYGGVRARRRDGARRNSDVVPRRFDGVQVQPRCPLSTALVTTSLGKEKTWYSSYSGFSIKSKMTTTSTKVVLEGLVLYIFYYLINIKCSVHFNLNCIVGDMLYILQMIKHFKDEAAIVAFSVYEHEDLEGRLLERDASFTRAALPNNTVVMY
uniref:Uncharacterized protein n=1 Tax=Aegilops tauschii TaxID=37682 RepID=M8AKD4_AEGTA